MEKQILCLYLYKWSPNCFWNGSMISVYVTWKYFNLITPILINYFLNHYILTNQYNNNNNNQNNSFKFWLLY